MLVVKTKELRHGGIGAIKYGKDRKDFMPQRSKGISFSAKL